MRLFRAAAMKLDRNRRCWLAAYTRSNHERQVARQLGQKNLEYLLPTYHRMVRWTDRIKRVEIPLFPSYIFVHICESERVSLLETGRHPPSGFIGRCVSRACGRGHCPYSVLLPGFRRR
jgi:hypothetical protein